MTACEVRAIAEAFVAKQEMRGHSVEYVGLGDRPQHPEEWSVTFDVYSPAGNLIDGRIVVIIDKRTMKARFFESP